MSAATQKGWETAGSGTTLPHNLPNLKNKFPVNFIFTESIFVSLSLAKKVEMISLKVFKIMVLKNWQQETTKGTLRS